MHHAPYRKSKEELSELTMHCKIVVTAEGEYSAATFGEVVKRAIEKELALEGVESVEVSECYGVAINRISR